MHGWIRAVVWATFCTGILGLSGAARAEDPTDSSEGEGEGLELRDICGLAARAADDPLSFRIPGDDCKTIEGGVLCISDKAPNRAVLGERFAKDVATLKRCEEGETGLYLMTVATEPARRYILQRLARDPSDASRSVLVSADKRTRRIEVFFGPPPSRYFKSPPRMAPSAEPSSEPNRESEPEAAIEGDPGGETDEPGDLPESPTETRKTRASAASGKAARAPTASATPAPTAPATPAPTAPATPAPSAAPAPTPAPSATPAPTPAPRWTPPPPPPLVTYTGSDPFCKTLSAYVLSAADKGPRLRGAEYPKIADRVPKFATTQKLDGADECWVEATRFGDDFTCAFRYGELTAAQAQIDPLTRRVGACLPGWNGPERPRRTYSRMIDPQPGVIFGPKILVSVEHDWSSLKVVVEHR